MIAQTSLTLRRRAPELADYGCYFLCLAYLGWAVRDPDTAYVSMLELIRGYKKAVEEEWCDKDCFIRQPAIIANEFARRPAWKYLGRGPKDAPSPGMPWEPGTKVPIIRWDRDKWSHFMLAGYDPMVGTSRTAREGRITSTRLFQLQGPEA